ncbi:MAG: RecQ family ATP-dependent DNA helicase [Chitinophagaceae bacterium]|nr:RecQ family ATP-dependent DNA helicase [Chitinophagaceae bacterium]
MQQPVDILKEYWGFDSFRPLQEDIIRSVLDGHDTLALLPTGGGKSVCYQVPALAMDGLCLVISPLIALMKDQVEGLRSKSITAYAIYSGMTRREVINTLKVAGGSNCKFLYVSPERLETNLFKEFLPGLGVSLIAVDEAHCISQWGYDFRPVYLRIAALRDELPDIPVLALTASATPDVQVDIMDRLTVSAVVTKTMPVAADISKGEYKNWKIFRQSFERPNLSYSCFRVESKINKILDVLNNVPGSSIVYCRSRRRCREMSELLQLHGISSNYYHAGLSREERDARQESWIKDETRVIVCTNAFGMGIDKPAVRSVIHADLPDCAESYYQEAGRAGRDGKKSYAVLLYGDKDLQELKESADTRFPDEAEIKSIYQSLANYLQLPSGEGAGRSFDFEISDFIQKFKHPVQTVLYVLRLLEQEGWMAFNEQVYVPAMAGFTTNKDELYRFEAEHPALEPMIKSMLRTYEGIFDQSVPIMEKQLAGLMRMDESEVKLQLTELASLRLIEYHPLEDHPRILLLRNRVRPEELKVDMQAVAHRKENYEKRLRYFIEYITDKQSCRSQRLSLYFGDEKAAPCGQCDNCLAQKKLPLSKEEFDMLALKITGLVAEHPVSSKDLLIQLTGISKEKAWQVIEFLQAEQKITVSSDGLVTKN